MSTVVPSFNSMVPMTFFSLTTLMLFSFSHWTIINLSLENVRLSKTVVKRNNLTHKRSTHEKYIQRLLWLILCFWMMDALDPCSDDDINNDVNSLYIEIIDKNGTYYKCMIWVVFMANVRNNAITILNVITNCVLPSFL